MLSLVLDDFTRLKFSILKLTITSRTSVLTTTSKTGSSHKKKTKVYIFSWFFFSLRNQLFSTDYIINHPSLYIFLIKKINSTKLITFDILFHIRINRCKLTDQFTCKSRSKRVRPNAIQPGHCKRISLTYTFRTCVSMNSIFI